MKLRLARVSFTIAMVLCALGSTPNWAQDGTRGVESVQETESFELQDRKPAPWYEPPVLRPRSGIPVVLDIKTSEQRRHLPEVLVPGPDGDELKQVSLRSYGTPGLKTNGLVGPTIRVPQNHNLRIRLSNELPPNRPRCNPAQHETPDCFDHTNFHTHGLHISPKGRADNVLISLAPKDEPIERCQNPPGRQCGLEPDPNCCFRGSFTHEYRIGEGLRRGQHYPGTFWYHAHKHGSTAVQLASGMAGALIVDDPVGSPFARYLDRVLMMQQLAFDDGKPARVLPEGGSLRELARNWGGGRNGPAKRYTTINGVAKPGIPMCPGEVQRWRLIDSGVFEMAPVELAWIQGDRRAFPETAQLIAYDGITVKKPIEVFRTTRHRPVEMGPGYRVDLLVKDSPGLRRNGYRLVLRKRAPTNPGWTFNGMEGPGANQILAEVVLDESGRCDRVYADQLLDKNTELPFPMGDIDEVDPSSRSVQFSVEARPEPLEPLFKINDRVFDHDVHKDFCLPFGGVEEWKLTTAKTQDGNDVHPFHIHVNAFQVIRDGKPAEWRDTILVKENEPVTIRTRYENFDGKFVLHCHILTHEDRGMMQMVEITDSNPPKCDNPHAGHGSH